MDEIGANLSEDALEKVKKLADQYEKNGGKTYLEALKTASKDLSEEAEIEKAISEQFFMESLQSKGENPIDEMVYKTGCKVHRFQSCWKQAAATSCEIIEEVGNTSLIERNLRQLEKDYYNDHSNF